MKFVIFFLFAALIDPSTSAGFFRDLRERTYSVEKAVRKNASILTKQDKEGNVTLHRCINGKTEKDYKNAEILIEAEIGLGIQNKYGSLPLHWALALRKEELAEMMISKESQILDVVNVRKNSPLHAASSEGFTYIVRKIVEKGGNVRLENKFGKTSLHIAAQNNRVSVVRYFIEETRIPVDFVNSAKLTALQTAAEFGSLDVIDVLIKVFKADKEANDDDLSCTPLAMAVLHGQLEAARALLKVNADKNYKFQRGTFEGMNIYHLAVRRLDSKMIILLKEMRVNEEMVGNNGKTALHYVSDSPLNIPNRRQKVENVLRFLLEGECKLAFVKDDNGDTALSYAVIKGDLDTVRYYLKRIFPITLAISSHIRNPLSTLFDESYNKRGQDPKVLSVHDEEMYDLVETYVARRRNSAYSIPTGNTYVHGL